MATVPTIEEVNSLASDRASSFPRSKVIWQHRFFRPELDVLRFAAFLLVFLHHGIYVLSPTLSRLGAFGLSLFFMLSAFLITELLQREKAANGSISVKSFYIRRALRIWPLYYGFLFFTLFVGWAFPYHRAPWNFVFAFILMYGNVYIGRNGYPNSSASFLWSISVEEQFYLFWPLLNQRCSRRALGWIAAGAFPVASLAVVYMARHSASNLGVWTNALVQFQIFAFGVLLSLALKGTAPRLSLRSRFSLFAFGLSLWFIAARWSGVDDPVLNSIPWLVVGYYLVGLGCAFIFLSIYGVQTEVLPRSLVYLGKISYGLYVFHEFGLEFASWILNRIPLTASVTHHFVYGVGHVGLGFLFTSVAAILSYRYFESPFLKLKDHFAAIQSRPA